MSNLLTVPMAGIALMIGVMIIVLSISSSKEPQDIEYQRIVCITGADTILVSDSLAHYYGPSSGLFGNDGYWILYVGGTGKSNPSWRVAKTQLEYYEGAKVIRTSAACTITNVERG